MLTFYQVIMYYDLCLINFMNSAYYLFQILRQLNLPFLFLFIDHQNQIYYSLIVLESLIIDFKVILFEYIIVTIVWQLFDEIYLKILKFELH